MEPSEDEFELVGNPLEGTHTVSASGYDSEAESEHGSGCHQEGSAADEQDEPVTHIAPSEPPVEEMHECKEPENAGELATVRTPAQEVAPCENPSEAEPTPSEVASEGKAGDTIDDDMLLREEWSQSECHMQDIRYAQQDAPDVPCRKVKKQLKILVCGQAETGKTMLIKNLFASYAKDPAWAPRDVSGLSVADFAKDATLFQTTLDGVTDASGNLILKYIIQEAPPLEGSAEVCIAALLKYINDEQSQYLQQEQDVGLARGELQDGRVDVCLYALPTNIRVSPFDCAVMQALGEVVPTVAVMCKADCMTEQEVKERRTEMRKLINDGLKLYTFPQEDLNGLRGDALGSKPDPSPFIVMVGNESDESVHPFWFVRKYRWGTCEAYRAVDSDLKWLRQLLLETGYWNLKDTADKLFRRAAAAKSFTKAPEDTATEAESDTERHDSANSHITVPTVPSTQSPTATSNATSEVMPWPSSTAAMTTLLESLRGHLNLELRDGSERSCGACRFTPSGTLDDTHSTEVSVRAQAVGVPANVVAFNFNESEYYQVEVQDVLRTQQGNTYRLTIHIPKTDKVLCMRIGASEGTCLLNAVRGIDASRPCTYDSWYAMLVGANGRIVRAVITHCADTVFYGRVHAVLPSPTGDKAIDVDVRPSDAFNLAIRCNAPIYLHRNVADQYSKSASKKGNACSRF